MLGSIVLPTESELFDCFNIEYRDDSGRLRDMIIPKVGRPYKGQMTTDGKMAEQSRLDLLRELYELCEGEELSPFDEGFDEPYHGVVKTRAKRKPKAV